MKQKKSEATANVASASPQTQSAGSDRLTVEQFTLLAIEKLADEGRPMIHTVYSGFNEAFRDYFPGSNPVKETEKLVKEGKIAFRFCRGGALIGKPGAIKAPQSSKVTLKRMGLQ